MKKDEEPENALNKEKIDALKEGQKELVKKYITNILDVKLDSLTKLFLWNILKEKTYMII